jgi:hypothetical protein
MRARRFGRAVSVAAVVAGMMPAAASAGRWAIQRTPNPVGASGSRLSGVSCTSVRVCAAVGYSGAETLAEVWNGTVWRIEPTLSTGATNGQLNGVSCVSVSACTAAGYDISQTTVTLVERHTRPRMRNQIRTREPARVSRQSNAHLHCPQR